MTVATKGQRQKDYRQMMDEKGFICKQFWIPKDNLVEVEKLVFKLKNQYVVPETEDLDDLI
jgi:hypothetical protein